MTKAVVQEKRNPLMIVIEKAVIDPNCDAEKMGKLLDMLRLMMASDAEKEFIRDFALMQSEFPSIQKNGKSHQNNYATFDDINDGTVPARGKYGFGLSFRPQTTDGMMTVAATLSHRGGHKETTTMSLPFDTSGNKNNVQAIGSSLTYGLRMCIKALLSISTHDGTDTDAEGLHFKITAEEAKKLQTTANKYDGVIDAKVFLYFSRKFVVTIESWADFPSGSFAVVNGEIEKQGKAKQK